MKKLLIGVALGAIIAIAYLMHWTKGIVLGF